MYQLFNETDGLPASPETFKTREQAEACAKRFRERFAVQGYYLTAGGERIPPREVRLVVIVVDS
jgi:hypothetical protein